MMGLEFAKPRWATAPRTLLMVKETAPDAGSVTWIPSNPIPDPIRLATAPVEMGPDPVSAVRIASTAPLEERWLVMGTERKTLQRIVDHLAGRSTAASQRDFAHPLGQTLGANLLRAAGDHANQRRTGRTGSQS